jgi:hypothetical protein
MRQAQWLVFDEYVAGGVLAYTNQDLNSKLGTYDQLALQAVVDNLSSTPPTAFKVTIQHSADGRTWMAKSAATFGTGAANPEIGGTTGITPGAGQTTYFGCDPGTAPTLAFVQLTISLTGAAGTGAHVRIYVTARDWGGR